MTTRHVLKQCLRCPQRFKQWYSDREQALCGDCRYVVTASERAWWEAE